MHKPIIQLFIFGTLLRIDLYTSYYARHTIIVTVLICYKHKADKNILTSLMLVINVVID